MLPSFNPVIYHLIIWILVCSPRLKSSACLQRPIWKLWYIPSSKQPEKETDIRTCLTLCIICALGVQLTSATQVMEKSYLSLYLNSPDTKEERFNLQTSGSLPLIGTSASGSQVLSFLKATSKLCMYLYNGSSVQTFVQLPSLTVQPCSSPIKENDVMMARLVLPAATSGKGLYKEWFQSTSARGRSVL